MHRNSISFESGEGASMSETEPPHSVLEIQSAQRVRVIIEGH